ncbi:MAG: tetratricopeptide repeat protein [Deltaproteobacteria bacterium]|nr:tetratricopeptide repeat protein [Deltaproteobacteria bacterium]
MADLRSLQNDITRAADNPAAAATARRRLVDALDADPSPEAHAAVAEALYRLGVTTLLAGKDLDGAMELFKRAVEKKQAEWSPLARTSWALTMHAKGKHQQAVFELRKVIPPGAPTPAAATALVLLCQVLRDMKAKPSEIEKADKERITALEQLVAGAPPGADRAHWQFLLAVAHREGGSRAECKKHLQEVVALGKAAGDPTLAAARDLLKGM